MFRSSADLGCGILLLLMALSVLGVIITLMSIGLVYFAAEIKPDLNLIEGAFIFICGPFLTCSSLLLLVSLPAALIEKLRNRPL